jgi:N-methylhydantoinase A
MSGRSVGIDVGGTYTDLVAIGEDGRAEARKVLSTPADQSVGVLAALDALGGAPKSLERVVHGTTIATNMLLERTGARVVLCATEGAVDLLDLRRQDRAALYDLARQHPPALVPPDRRVGVASRVEPEGETRALAPEDAVAAAERAMACEPDIIAVAMLHSYIDPRHEEAVAKAIQAKARKMVVVRSSEVLPEIREYERTATTVAEAYLRPGVSKYLARLGEQLAARGAPPLAVLTSSGGMRTGKDAASSAAALALSGPAGGVVGAAFVARLAGFNEALTIDIGGTSADAGLVLDGEPITESGGEVAGVPIALPRVLVETVSAGGGSLGWVDDGGALRVGPRSAGVVPGPAAFGRGGTEATVTDAHLVLGNFRQSRLSGGVTLDIVAARAAVGRLAEKLGVDAERTARAMIAAADAAMARALRRVSVERGADPRRAVLVAFGGGGPLHGCALAEHLGMRTVLVPPFAGVLSALGLAIAAERRETLTSVMRRVSELDPGDTRRLAHTLSGKPDPAYAHRWWARSRYQGQGHELEVTFEPGDTGGEIAARFTEMHERRFGFTLPREIEIISARHAASGLERAVVLARRGAQPWSAEQVDDGGELEVTMRGRAVISLPDATLLVAPGWTARALAIGGWLLEKDA